jgi:hypothetical protein
MAAVPLPIFMPEAEPYQRQYDFLSEQRLIIQTELDWREEMIQKADSYLDKGPNEGPYPGYRSKSVGALRYLDMQLAIMDARLDEVRDDARRAGVYLETR